MNAKYSHYAVLVRQHTRYIVVRNAIRQDEKHAQAATARFWLRFRDGAQNNSGKVAV